MTGLRAPPDLPKDAVSLELCCRTMLMFFINFASRDLIPIIAALEYNQWFTKLSSKDLKLVSHRK